MINLNRIRSKPRKVKKTPIINDDDTNSEGEISSKNLPIPVDTEGYWVKREKFFRDKSFGYFVCKDCTKTWLSAHSYKKYKQGCKGCETENYPKYLWFNSIRIEKDPKFEELNKEKPHDKERCEACHLGFCLDKLTIK